MKARRMAAPLREPLLQFLVYGALLLLAKTAFDHWRPSPRGVIEVPTARIEALRAELAAQWHRPPAPSELTAATRRWVDEELLVHEALSLGLDRGDTIVRRRLIQKIESLVDTQVEGETPNDAALQALLDADPARYGQATRYRFEQLFFSRSQRGERLHTDAEAALHALLADPNAAVPADPFFADRQLPALDRRSARKLFGPEFADQLDRLPLQRWSGPVISGYGLHLIKLEERIVAKPTTLAEARPRLSVDWRLQRRQALIDTRLERLRRQYRVELGATSQSDAPLTPPAREDTLAEFD